MKVLNIRFPFILVVVLISTIRCEDSTKPEAKDGSSTSVGVIINNTTEVPDGVTTITVQTVVPDPNTTTTTTTTSTTTISTTTATTSTTKPTETTTISPTTTQSTTTKPTTQPPTPKPTTATPSTTAKPVDPTTTPVPPKDRHFDGASFIGGIILAVGLMGIGFIAFKFYKARTERNYHTL